MRRCPVCLITFQPILGTVAPIRDNNKVNKEQSVMKHEKFLCSMILLTFFGLDRAHSQYILNFVQATDKYSCFQFRYLAIACDQKTTNVHGCSTFNM